MIERFEVGKYYRYIGEGVVNWTESMNFVLDNKPHQCTDRIGYDGRGEHAVFASPLSDHAWYWTLADFVEVMDIRITEDILFLGDSK